jgi:hypothetical protein
MVSAGVVVEAAMVTALAVSRRTVPLQLGSMVDLLGFEANIPPMRPTCPHVDAAERLQSADIQFRREVRAPRAWPCTMAETGVLPRNSMETSTARSASTSSQPLWFGSFVRLRAILCSSRSVLIANCYLFCLLRKQLKHADQYQN